MENRQGIIFNRRKAGRLSAILYAQLAAAALVLALAACSPAPAASPPPPTPAASPAPTLTASPAPSSTPVVSPTPRPSPTPTCLETTGRLEDYTIPAEPLAKPLQISLYLPPCYDPQREPGYPVLYLLHGQGSTQQQWPDLGAPAAADELITSSQVPPFLIVMPFEEYSFQHPFRTGYREALTDVLPGWVDGQFNTCPERVCRAIGGLSRGAAWAVHLGFSHPELFGAIGAHSLPFFYGDDLNMPNWVRAIPAGELPRVYLDIGEFDPYLEPAATFDKLLTALDVPHEWILREGNHVDAYWSSHVREYLLWYGQGFPQP